MNIKNNAEKIRRRKLHFKYRTADAVLAHNRMRRSMKWIFAIISFLAIFVIQVSTEFLPATWLDLNWLDGKTMFALSFNVIVFLLAVIWFAPKIYVRALRNKIVGYGRSEFDHQKEMLKLEDEARKTVAQIVGGLVFLSGVVFTYNTLVLNRETQFSDRFNRALMQLGDNEGMGIKIGGLYALERIAKDSPKEHWTIMEILSAYIREKPSMKRPNKDNRTLAEKEATWKGLEIDPDVQIALTIIGRRDAKQDPFDGRIDLRDINLLSADFINAYLTDVDFSHANLTHANFTGANLTKAKLLSANLSETNFQKVNLTGADLERAGLFGANLSYSILNGANLRGASDLTFYQLSAAIIDEKTILPSELEDRRQELLTISKENLQKLAVIQADEYKQNRKT